MLDIFNNQKMQDGFPVLHPEMGMFALWAGTAARENTPVSVIDMKKAANRQPFSSVRLFTAALQQLLQPLTAPEDSQ